MLHTSIHIGIGYWYRSLEANVIGYWILGAFLGIVLTLVNSRQGVVVVVVQTYSKKAVDQVQEALTQAQKTQVLSQNIFQVLECVFTLCTCLFFNVTA